MPLFLSNDQNFANPEEFLPLRFHRSVQKSFENNLGRYNDFKAQKRQAKSTVIPFNTSGTTGTRQKQTQECKNHCCSFKSVGTTSSLAETDSKGQTQSKIVIFEVTPPESPEFNKTGLTRYNKTDPTDSV